MDRHKLVINNVKINAIFLVLFILNIVLYVFMIRYFFTTYDFHISIRSVSNIATIISAIIILGFISTRLPQFRKFGNSSIYEVSYLLLFGILSIVISYFNKSTNTETFFAPYIEMFKILSIMIIFTLIATKIKSFKDILNGKITRRNQLICLVIFTALGCIASKYHVYVGDTPANVRCLIIMIGGLFGGPVVGIPSAIISGGFRYIQGGVTAFPCAVTTVVAGIIGSLIYELNGRKFLNNVPAVLLMFLFTGFEMLMIVVLTPADISFPFVSDIYPLMLFASVTGMVLFLMIVREGKIKKKEISYEELKFKEMENSLYELGEKVDELEEEIERLRKDDSD